MKRTSEKIMMKTILLSAILLSNNCVTQVEYFDTGANKGDVNIYNPPSNNSGEDLGPATTTDTVEETTPTVEETTPEDSGVVILPEQPIVDYPIDEENGSGDSIFSINGDVEAAMVVYYMSNPVAVSETNIYVVNDEEIKSYMQSLSYEDLVLFEAMFRIASDIHNFPGGSKYLLAQYWAEDIDFTQDVIYNTLFEMDESFVNFFSDISSRYSANDLIFYTNSVIQAQRVELDKRMRIGSK